MTRPDWRKPCPTGCTCGKHSARKYVCKDGCTCARHMERLPCPDGCACGRHRSQRCKRGCDCSRHKSQATLEQKEATRERERAWNREYARRRRLEDPVGTRERAKALREANPEKARRYYLKSKFGITLEAWQSMFDAQGMACYLCGDALDGAHIHVDHDHACCPGNKSCGACVRGLACRWCNQGLGQFRDDPARMRRAADALEAATARIQLGARA
jgi:hypothetical protein